MDIILFPNKMKHDSIPRGHADVGSEGKNIIWIEFDFL